MKSYKYTVFIEPDESGGYFAFVPLLSGCVAQGETIEETKEMIKDAISGYIKVLLDEGEHIPQESEKRIETKISVPLSVVI